VNSEIHFNELLSVLISILGFFFVQVTWKNMNNASAVPQSKLFMPFVNEFNITGLNPSYNLCVTVVVITPSTRGPETQLPFVYPFGNGKGVIVQYIAYIFTCNCSKLKKDLASSTYFYKLIKRVLG